MATVGQGPTSQLRVGLWDALTLLGRNGDFARLYTAELISFAGDWFATVAILGLVNQITGSAALTTLVLVAQMIATAAFSPIGGYLADRLDRKRLMIGADIVRVLLALGYLLIDGRGDVWLAFVLTAGISALSAVFTPASNASVPNLVDPEDLPAANVLVGAAWGTMLAVGAALGGVVAAAFGRDAAFVGDAVSFVLSAVLLVGIRRRFAEAPVRAEHPRMFEAIRETVRYARRDRRVLALLTVKGGFGLGAGVIGLLPILALEVFDAGDRGTGILWGFRGIGALVGPFLVSRFTRDLRSLLAAIGVAFVVYGVFYGAVPLMTSLWPAAVLVMLAHLGGGAQWTLSTYGLQRIVPDHIRGRVFSFDFGLVTLTLALSILIGGWAADHFDPRAVMAVMAGVALTYAVVWSVATTPLRRSAAEFDSGPVRDLGTAGRV
jgi:MFS family permease